MLLIGICGNRQAGKDTVADYLVEKYKFQSEVIDKRLGEFIAEMFMNTPIGKTILALFGGDITTSLTKFPQLINLTHEGILSKVEKLNENSIKLIMINTPYPAAFFGGVIEYGIKQYNNTFSVKWEEPTPKTIEYTIQWNQSN